MLFLLIGAVTNASIAPLIKSSVAFCKDNKAYFKALDIEAKSDDELAIKDGINKDDLILIPNNSKKPLSEGMRIHK